MQENVWESKEQLRTLINELVNWESRTGTKGEIEFPHKLKTKLLNQPYFKEYPSYIELHDADLDRNVLTAFYQSDLTGETIVLLSHFDTVQTDNFSDLADLAFKPEALTKIMKDRKDLFPQDVKEDIEKNEYLFGRGVMDMKMGLALHMHLLEQASKEKWPINILLVTVPDEEVNSAGMRTAVNALINLREKYKLKYKLFLNSEPSFSQTPGDNQYYIYSGTIGKILPSALFYGRETHAGEPLSGLTGHYMNTYLTQAMEFNDDFIEEVHGEKTPLPICLQTNDLKQDYSAQTSHHSYALYNVFTMKRNAKEIMNIFKTTAEKAMKECQVNYEAICRSNKVKPIGKIKVFVYEVLFAYALEKLGLSEVKLLTKSVLTDNSLDEREKSVKLTDQLMVNCPELAPATVLFYAPPYYPAVNSSENELVDEVINFAIDTLNKKFDVETKQIHYFNGISDLSYVNYKSTDFGWKAYEKNTPVWGETYQIPFEAMQKLQAPILNIGPFGKDAHKLTERLHIESAFVQTPYLLKEVIKSLFSQ